MRIAHFYNSETEEMTTRESSIGFFNGIANQFPINSLMVKNDIATYQTWKVIKNTNIRGGSKYAIQFDYVPNYKLPNKFKLYLVLHGINIKENHE